MIKDALPGSMIMSSVPVCREETVHIARSYEGVADYLLLDSHRPSDNQIGTYRTMRGRWYRRRLRPDAWLVQYAGRPYTGSWARPGDHRAEWK
jgi:hypothetical protein